MLSSYYYLYQTPIYTPHSNLSSTPKSVRYISKIFFWRGYYYYFLFFFNPWSGYFSHVCPSPEFHRATTLS